MILGIAGKKGSGKDTVAKIIQYLTYCNVIEQQNRKPFHKLEEFLSDKANSLSGWQTKRFANKVKDIVCLLINCTKEQLEDGAFKEKPLGEEWKIYEARGWNFENQIEYNKYASKDDIPKNYTLIQDYLPTPRLLLQLIGTECGRNIIHPNIWVNSLMSEYKPTNDCQQHSDGLFYTDEHGENEVIPIYPNWIIPDVRFHNEIEVIKKMGGYIWRIERSGILIDKHPSETALDNYKDFNYTIDNSFTIEHLIGIINNILHQEKII